MSEPQPSNGADMNAGNPATAGLESLAAVGSRLAQLREAKGWSVDDVSARLKVAPQKLRALEAGDISHLPGLTFALGVVRSYAKMLGVDPEPFAQALRRERGVPEIELSLPAAAGADLPRGRVSIPLGGATRHRPWLWGAAAAVVALIAAAMWHTGGDSSNWLARFKGGAAQGASGAQVQQAAIASAPAAESASSVGASAVAASDASASAVAGSAPAATAAAASLPAVVAASVASAAPAVAAAPASQPAAAVVPPASAAAAAQASQPAVPTGQSMVELKVKQDCWFSVRDKNGKELFSALVRAGETKQVAGAAPLKVTVGNLAGLDVVAFDGKTVDPAKYSATRGNVARFTLP
ncbi:cytoskeleton protein RodZ [Burkholderia multivorans]